MGESPERRRLTVRVTHASVKSAEVVAYLFPPPGAADSPPPPHPPLGSHPFYLLHKKGENPFSRAHPADSCSHVSPLSLSSSDLSRGVWWPLSEPEPPAAGSLRPLAPTHRSPSQSTRPPAVFAATKHSAAGSRSPLRRFVLVTGGIFSPGGETNNEAGKTEGDKKGDEDGEGRKSEE